MEKANKNFITISMMCIFLLVMMISFGSVTVNETFSAEEVACYACSNTSSNSNSGSYLWGDYSSKSDCNKMTGYTTKESCLVNNCSGTQKLDADGNCTDNSGKVTVLFKSGSLTLHKSTCTLINGECRIALPTYQNAIGWSEEADCSKVVETSKGYIAFNTSKTYTYYSCKESTTNSNVTTTEPSTNTDNNTNSNTNNSYNDSNNGYTNDNPETGSSIMIVIFLGGFLMIMYSIYVYRNSIKLD